METTDRIRQILADPASADPSVLIELTKRYPSFALPGILLLKYHPDALDPRRIEALRLHLALCTGDRRALYDLVGGGAPGGGARQTARAPPPPGPFF